MKDKLYELMKQAHEQCVDCKDCEYKGEELCADRKMADFLIANGVAITKAEKCTASLDYEKEYYRLLEERECLMAQMAVRRSEKESLETEFIRLRAQLDIVHLIFGGK